MQPVQRDTTAIMSGIPRKEKLQYVSVIQGLIFAARYCSLNSEICKCVQTDNDPHIVFETCFCAIIYQMKTFNLI